MSLKCTVPGCRREIHAFTGLQELQKLGSHFRRVHSANLSMEQLLELRIKMENGETIFVAGKDLKQ